MAMKIFKYEIGDSSCMPVGDHVLMMPQSAHILHAGFQNDRLCVWAMVQTNCEKVKRSISVFGTGHNIPFSHGQYVGSAVSDTLVWHVLDNGTV